MSTARALLYLRELPMTLLVFVVYLFGVGSSALVYRLTHHIWRDTAHSRKPQWRRVSVGDVDLASLY